MSHFAEQVLTWFDQHGRKHLPWQHNPTPYRVWISEVMLQQTQVNTVIPYYERFMASFPDVLTLADAKQDWVLNHWQGLGYYSRARHLHKAAQQIRDEHAGQFPQTLDAVQALPGIGRSTAGAILSLSLNQSHAILDGNVKRVLARYHAIPGWPGETRISKRLWNCAEQHLPSQRHADYTQAMMDMGATLCTRSKPLCLMCPLKANCQALKQGNVSAYPGSKPKKALPDKQAYALLLCNAEGEYLLQKRPPTGIWGGLWSFPEFTDMNEALQWANTRGFRDLPAVEQLTPLQHTFSHYRLTLTPLLLNLPTSTGGIMADDGWLWYNRQQTFSGGLSSAAQKLLQQKE